MTNKEIAKTFQYLGDIMELHGENPFKIRSYKSAYITLRKLASPLSDMTDAEINDIKGVGKAIAGKIRELLDNSKMETLEKYKEMTPSGVQDMLHIKGFGPKKIKAIWKDLEVESIGELLYAVNENRLIELKGFGKKTQDDLKNKLEYYNKSKNRFHYATVEKEAFGLVADLQQKLSDIQVCLTGQMRRRCNEIDHIEVLMAANVDELDFLFTDDFLLRGDTNGNTISAKTANEFPVTIYTCAPGEFGSKLFRYTASEEFLTAFIEKYKGVDFKNLAEEKAVFDLVNLPVIAPEMRESEWAIELAAANNLPQLLDKKDVKGVLHAHSTYSDGLHSLRDMAEAARDMGYEYLGITDHSKAAFYANGLKEDRLRQQWAEIDELNKELAPFKIFKGIESDILNDGSLDYPETVLAEFDFIIASVHTNLRMDEEKATQRLITAIENKYTTILGHPTSRLLLSREGYPLDHQRIIDACAEHNVAIELNANPYRLDIDWTWIPYALEKGVLISVNPDAHSKEGIEDIHFGVLSARKGGLTAEMCLCAKSLEMFEKYIA